MRSLLRMNISLCLILGSILMVLTFCTRFRKEIPVKRTETKIPVRIQVIAESPMVIPVSSTGILVASTQAKLSFKTGGIIQGIKVTEGTAVKAGTLLATLDLSEIKARERQTTLVYEKTLRDYRRVMNLYRDTVATLEQLENARTAKEVAMNNMKIAQFNLKHAVIYAPSDGKILKQLAEEGEVIGAGYPVFVFASTSKAWVVRVVVPDKDVVRLSLQDSAKIDFDVWPKQHFTGKVTEIAQASDPATGTYQVEVTLDTAKLKLVSGLLAKVILFPSDTLHSITAPLRALVGADRMNATVFTIKKGRARRSRISIDGILDSIAIVGDGLAPGDTLVTSGMEELDEGAPVRLISTDNPRKP